MSIIVLPWLTYFLSSCNSQETWKTLVCKYVSIVVISASCCIWWHTSNHCCTIIWCFQWVIPAGFQVSYLLISLCLRLKLLVFLAIVSLLTCLWEIAVVGRLVFCFITHDHIGLSKFSLLGSSVFRPSISLETSLSLRWGAEIFSPAWLWRFYWGSAPCWWSVRPRSTPWWQIPVQWPQRPG